MSSEPFVTVEDVDAVRWLTLDNPARRNAVPATGWSELGTAFRSVESAPVRALVITGSGGDFSSGADLAGVGDLPASPAQSAERVRAAADAALALHRVPIPTVAAVDGVAFGAGMNLAIGCDVVVATERARFSQVFVRRGLALDTGGTWLLPRLVGHARARDLALTGREVTAEEAARIGLVSRVVDPESLDEVVTSLARGLAAGATLAQRLIKGGLDRSMSFTFEQALAYETQAQAVALAGSEAAEGVAAFLQRREARFADG